jgi:hypothetical protein
MSRGRPRFRIVALVFTALGLAGCQASRDDVRDDPGSGLAVDVGASEETLLETGISSWEVTDNGSAGLSVVGRAEDGASVIEMVGMHGDALGIEMIGSGNRIVFDDEGEIVENSLTEADLAFVRRFHDDGAAQLDDPGFRDWAECTAAAASAGATCGNAVRRRIDPREWVRCGVDLYGAGSACWQAYNESPNNTGGTGGQQTTGTQEGEAGDEGGSDGGGESGGSDGEAGSGESGSEAGTDAGEESGGESGGDAGETGGGAEDGGGYDDDGGYDGGEADGGYGYDEIPDPDAVVTATLVPIRDASTLAFSSPGHPGRPSVGAWNLHYRHH